MENIKTIEYETIPRHRYITVCCWACLSLATLVFPF